MDKQEATKLIAEELAKARACLDKAVELSEASGVMFSLPWGGEGSSEAGIGADYIPTTASQEDKDRWLYHSCSWREDGWIPSAGSC